MSREWMMARSPFPAGEVVAAALCDLARSVTPTAPGAWALAVGGDAVPSASVRLDEDWLLFDVPLCTAGPPAVPSLAAGGTRTAPAADAWKLLACNASLPGGVKFVTPAGGTAIRARAELPLDADVDVHRRVRETCAGLVIAADWFRAGAIHTDETPSRRPLTNGASLNELCEAAGWSFRERPDGRLAVDLAMDDGLCQATVERQGSGEVHASVELTVGAPEPAPRCRWALGVLLLRASATVRMMRAAGSSPDASVARLEVVFTSEPRASEMTHALSALAVACRLYLREAALLRHDEVVAEAFLAMVGHES